MIGHVFSALALLLGASASFQDVPQDKGIVVTGEKKQPDPNRRVCRGETPTGSLMRKTVCHTAAEMRALERKSEETLKQMRREEAAERSIRCARNPSNCF